MTVQKKILCTALLSLCLIAACKNEPANNKPSGTTVAPPSTTATKPEVFLYHVEVNNLLVREQPSRAEGVKVVTKVQEGDFVTGTGEQSSNKEEVEIRGIPMKEAYHKITTTTPEQLSGWAFGGALTLVYAGSNADSPDLGKLSQFSAFLKTLDTKQLGSGRKAWDYVQSNFGNVQGSLADAAYTLLNNFMRHMESEGEFYKMAEQINWTEADYTDIYANKFNMGKYAATKAFADNGFTLESAEGMVFPITDGTKLNAFFLNKLTPAYKAYAQQVEKESINRESDDGGLLIPISEVAERAVFWEKFNTQYPYFINKQETENYANWSAITLICGMNNTPFMGYEDGATVSEEFKQAWQMVQQKYPDTKIAARCKEFGELCAAEGWKRTEKVSAYLEKMSSAE